MSDLDLATSFSNLWTEITCPNCKIANRIRLKEILIESSIICRGCYKDFHLVQADASGFRSKQSMQQLQEEIEKLSQQLTIRIGF